MRNIKITIEFDGTNYCGWQVQKNGISVQQMLQKAVEGIAGHGIKLIGSSRTDAGVHAKGMVANFETTSNIPVMRFAQAINTGLPRDIVVIQAEEEGPDFHSRYSCTGKMYSYTILNRKMPSALLRNYTAHIPEELDIGTMKLGAEYLLGTHDFSAFKSSGSKIKNNVRTVRLLNIFKNGDIIRIEIEADGFLYNMVRIIVGTLIEIGVGKKNPEDVKTILINGERSGAGKTAPACGLCLEYVCY